MTRTAAALYATLIVAFLIIALLQNRELANLRAQNSSLQQSPADSAAPAAEQSRSLNPSATAAAPSEPAWFPELLRLRGEAVSQRRELTDLQIALARARTNAAARAEAAKTYFPKSSWASAGNSTPEAALLSQQGGDANPWKLAKGLNRDQLKVLIKTIIPPEQQAEAQKELDSHTDAEVADIIDQGLKADETIDGIRIVDKQVLSDDEVKLTYMNFLNNGTNDGWGITTFKRDGNQWKPSVFNY